MLPVFSNHPPLSKHQHHEQTLDSFSEFYINWYTDHHAYEVVTQYIGKLTSDLPDLKITVNFTTYTTYPAWKFISSLKST